MILKINSTRGHTGSLLVPIDYIELLLFSTNFVISVWLGDVEMEKMGSFCHRQKKISLYFPSIKIFRVFFSKGGRSSAFMS